MDRLPTEVVRYIFLLCPDTFTPDGFICIHPLSAPILLTQVCREWRMLVRNTPELWCNMALPALSHDLDKAKLLLAATKEWLSFSSQTPLSLRYHDTQGRVSVVTEYLRHLFDHAHRWHAIRLQIPGYDLLAQMPLITMPILQRLDILTNSTRAFDDVSTNPLILAIQQSVHLRHLSLGFIDRVSAFVIAISQSPRLSSLSFGHIQRRFELDEDEGRTDLSSISMPQLRHLSMTWRGWNVSSTYRTLLPNLLVDHLESLQLTVLASPSSTLRGLSGPLCALVTCCSRTLTTLALHNALMPTSELLAILGCTPYLKRLELHSMIVTASIVKALTLRFSSAGILEAGLNPQLRSITIDGLYNLRREDFARFHVEESDFTAFWTESVNMVQSRWQLPCDTLGSNIPSYERVERCYIEGEWIGWHRKASIQEASPEQWSRVQTMVTEGLVWDTLR